MKKFILTLLVLLVLFLSTTPAIAAFVDVPSSHWAKVYIEKLADKGTIKGYEYNIFKPDSFVTRAEFLKMVYLILKASAVPEEEVSFIDVKPADWFYNYVVWAHSEGVVSGYSDNTFKPQNLINRAEALKIIFNSLGLDDLDEETRKGLTTFPSDSSLKPFSDVPKNAWFAEYAAWAQIGSIIKGKTNGLFAPADYITRAEAAKIIFLAFL